MDSTSVARQGKGTDQQLFQPQYLGRIVNNRNSAIFNITLRSKFLDVILRPILAVGRLFESVKTCWYNNKIQGYTPLGQRDWGSDQEAAQWWRLTPIGREQWYPPRVVHCRRYHAQPCRSLVLGKCSWDLGRAGTISISAFLPTSTLGFFCRFVVRSSFGIIMDKVSRPRSLAWTYSWRVPKPLSRVT